VQPEFKGFNNPSKNQFQPPAIKKKKKNQHKIKGHNPRVDLCPLIEQKIKKIGGFLEKLGFGFFGKKKGNWGVWVAGGGWAQWRRAGGGVSVVGGVDAGGGLGLFGF
jgi:hypothetical protein